MAKVTNDDRDSMRGGEAHVAGGPSPKKEDWIGRQLRRVFDDAVSEPLPDDLMSLLERIDEENTQTPSTSRNDAS